MSTTLIFDFKTHQRDGLLFFIGDNLDPYKATNYMYLVLKNGQLNLVTQIHFFTQNEEVKIENKVIMGKNLNDLKWHEVEVVRNGTITIMILDKNLRDQNELGEGRHILHVGLLLYVGGIPRRYKERNCGEIDIFRT